MAQIPYIISASGQITIVDKGGGINIIPTDHERYQEVLRRLSEPNADIQRILMYALNLSEAEQKVLKEVGVEVTKGGKVTQDGVDVGDNIKKMLQDASEGKDNKSIKALVAFFDRVAQNPIPDIQGRLYAFLKTGNFPICADGSFIGYKGVREDWMDCHSNTKRNMPGDMPTEENFDTNANEACGRGLHVGNWRHASGFGQRRVAVKVDPADVVSVPYADSTKLRCKKYFVLAETDSEFESEVLVGVKVQPTKVKPTKTPTNKSVAPPSPIKTSVNPQRRDPITNKWTARADFKKYDPENYELGRKRGSVEGELALTTIKHRNEKTVPYVAGYVTGYNKKVLANQNKTKTTKKPKGGKK